MLLRLHPDRQADPALKRPKVTAKAIDNLIVKAWEQGWMCRKRRDGHVMAYSPDSKAMVLMPGTPSDYRGIRNCRQLLRKYGLKL